MSKSAASTPVFYTLLSLFAVSCSAYVYEWMNPPQLSSEASSYQQIHFEVISGISLINLIQTIVLMAGASFGLISLFFLAIRYRKGIFYLRFLPIFVILLVVFNLNEPFYPALDNQSLDLLFCLAGMLWGWLLSYITVHQDSLFKR